MSTAAPPLPRPARVSLRHAAASGVRWTFAATLVGALVGLGQVALLANLLTPRDFGLAATVMLVAGIAQVFADLGLSGSIIAKQTTDRRVLASLYWANVACGVALGAGLAAAAPLLAGAFGEPELDGLLRWAAVGFAVAPLGLQFQVVAQRDLRFGFLAGVDVGSRVLGLAVAGAAALAGAGALALVLGMLTVTVARACVLAACGWRRARPALRLRRDDLRGHLRFGAFQLGERVTNHLSANVDYLLVGLLLGPHALGLYFLAYQAVIKPLQIVNPALTRVAFPVLARSRDGDRAAAGFLTIARLVALTVAPPLAILAVTAPLAVPLLFGERWADAVPLFQLLAGVGAMKALANPIGAVLLACDRPDVNFRVNLVWLAVLVAALVAGAQAGATGVAAAYLVVGLAAHLAWPLVLRRAIGLDPGRYARALVPPLAYAAVAGAAALASAAAMPASAPALPAIAVQAATGATALGLLLVTRDRAYVRELWTLLIARPPGREPPPPAAAVP